VEINSDFMTATDSIGDWMKNVFSYAHKSLENGIVGVRLIKIEAIMVKITAVCPPLDKELI
jgi:hypothetical protein